MPAFDRAKTLLTAEKFVKAGKLAEAVTEYKKLADDNPRDMNVVNKLGDLLVRAGRVPDALKHFLRIADYYAREGFFLKAIAMYKKICKIDPNNLDCQQRLAALYQQQGLTTEAKTQFLQVAEALMRQGQGDGAAESLRKVLEVDPDNHKVRHTLAELLARSSKPDEAAKEYCVVARVAAARGALEETVQLVRKAVKATPGHPEAAAILLAAIVKVEAIPADVVTTASDIARTRPRSSLAHVLQAEAMRRSGRHADAAEAFRHLSEGADLEDDLTPEALAIVGRFHASRDGSPQAWEALDRSVARLLTDARTPEAGALVDEFLKRSPAHRQALATRAEIAAKEGNPEVEGVILMRLVRVLIDEREHERAGEVLNRLVTLRPGDPVVVGLREELGAPGSAHLSAGAASGAGAPASVPADPPALSEAGSKTGLPEIPIVVGNADEESASADQIFSLEDDPLVVEEEPALPPPAADLGGSAEAQEEAYGPDSRIQEIQAAEAGGEPVDEEFVSEHITEAEVFVKYGLQEKAREQLRAVLDRYPQHEATHRKLKEIYVNEGNTEAAIRECLTLAELRRSQGREAEAREIVNEALRIDPESPLLQGIAPGASDRVSPAVAHAASSHERDERGAKDDTPAPAPPRARKGGPSVKTAVPDPVMLADEALKLEDDLEIEIEMPERAKSRADRTPEAGPDFAATTARTSLPLVAERIEEESPDDVPETQKAGKGPDEPDLIDELAQAAEVVAEEPGSGRKSREPKPAVRPDRRSGEPDEEKLGEVDFYVEQGLIDEARQVLYQLRKQYPGSAAVTDRLKRLDSPEAPEGRGPAEAASGDVDFEVEQALAGKSREAEAPAAPRAARPRPVFRVEKTAPAPGGEFFDLAAELDASLAEEQERDEARDKEALDGQAHSFEDIFAAFKKGVAQQVDSDDSDTHYNLGIAYKEMGLVDEAIGELQFAARDPARTLECCGILGLCFRDKGMPDLALKWYRRGLDHPGLDEHQTLGLRYDMAEVLREKGEFDQALRMYTEVYGIDSTYREVSARIKEVRGLKTSSGR